MDLWTFQRYKQPRLCVDAIDCDESERIVTVRAGPQSYQLAFDDSSAASEVAAELATLRDSRAPLWSTLKESQSGTGWYDLVNFLDTRSLISETNGDTDGLARQAKTIQDCIDETVVIKIDSLSAKGRSLAAVNASSLRAVLKRGCIPRGNNSGEPDPFDPQEQPNFFLALLAVEFEYFRRSCLLTLAAVDKLLARIAGDGDSRIDINRDPEFSEMSGVFDLRDLQCHLWLIAHCVAHSTSEHANRFKTAPIPDLVLSSGLEFMRQTELLTRNALTMWGPNRYVTALEELTDSGSPLIAGPYIEQYHVTRRFVEIVAPLLSTRLSVPLRNMMFRYFGEEFGHEALESATCEALGVTKRALDTMLPLPLHFAFVDALTTMADLDPVTSFAAVMVIEGVFGEPPKLSLRLQSVGEASPAFRNVSKEHDELNETLNHNSISRDCFEHISAVNEARQAQAIRRVLFLLELNHRAWDDIANFYGGQQALTLQGPFGRPLSPQS
jgi:hypothetical protein